MFLKTSGEIGIGTDTPTSLLEVAGEVAMKKRVGSLFKGVVNGDGYWHPITPKLDGCAALEVIAKIKGAPKSGKYAITHAIAISTYGNSHSAINATEAWYGSKSHKIEFRWTGTIHSFQLEVRTRCDYGSDKMIHYSIMEL